jgi:predicted acetyltransferase
MFTMIDDELLRMPRELGDDLLLRWGRPEDANAVADFNVRMHSDHPPEREEWLGDWTRDLMSGIHPTTTAADVTIVEKKDSGEIVSSLALIPQTWSMEGVSFGVGRPELIATDEAYRRHGLVRKQMDVAHALSARKGHMVQAITGIPWFYRMFGYEMAIDLFSGREYFWTRPGNDKPLDEETYQIREVTVDDIPLLDNLYRIHHASSLVVHERNEAIWQYHLRDAHRNSAGALEVFLIRDTSDQDVAYLVYEVEGGAFFVTEFGVVPGHSWRSVALFVVRELKRRADELHKTREKVITTVSFRVSETHPVLEALGRQLEKARGPYAWYVRVPDLPGFVRHIRLVLESRMADSVVAGHTGTLRLNFYQDTLRLTFKAGKLVEIDRYDAKDVEDGDALFPNLTFLQLLFGYRSFEQVDHAYADCYARNAEAAVLLKVLFPKRPSSVLALE